MPNPVGKYKFWDSTTANGLGTSANDFWPALEAELDAWISAISGNASLTGSVPIKLKGTADSTNANYLGFVVELPHSTDPSMYVQSYCSSSVTMTQRVGETYSDNGTQGGYGAISGVSDTESGSWTATGIDLGIFLAYDTTDGEEFFVAGRWGSDTISFHDPLVIIVRGIAGNWSGTVVDTTTSGMVFYDRNASTFVSSSISTRTGSEMTFFSSAASTTSPGISQTSQFVTANSRILTTYGSADTGDSFGDAPYTAYATAYYGPTVIIG
jgi:hypothetical protein